MYTMESTISNKSNVKMVIKSVLVPDHLWHQFCVRAAEDRKTLQVLLAEALEQYLAPPEAEQSEAHG